MIISFVSCASNNDAQPANDGQQGIESVDFSQIPDGNYTGSAKKFVVRATVSVDVKDGEVTDIEILKHVNGKGKKAEAITADVIREQSLDVDVISSATLSSRTILEAIENALTQDTKTTE
ncbi:FMN-binding protein [Brucepastera parasyntrophica]|uniref:FMN-binding protein n=1 Tax=Brucepastera parasyntrophica TaxID=2880008 RepID=UPI00210F1F3A|nr:FMN-binding protein [Brucepastera parasyntrophica]ULQ60985.1 FMN-binding protein [Brucepastera parasyntrophica]